MKSNQRWSTQILYKGNSMPKKIESPDCPPIFYSTACEIEDMDDYDFANGGGKYYYNRTAAPNRDMLAETISYMEGGEASIITSSGMAAISATLLSLLKSGDRILCSNAVYGETIELLEDMLKKFGIVADYVDFTDTEKVKEMLTPNTKILYTEIISNPLINVVNIDEISAIVKKNGALMVVDSTFTTPFAIRPLEHGADIVIHSLTKFFGGHSDITAGAVTSSIEIINIINKNQLLLGSCLDANSSWLALRSIRTMKLRVEKQMENADKIAQALAADSRVCYVNYPSLKSHPQHDLAVKLFKNGFGPMLSFRVEDSREKVNMFIQNLNMIKYLGTLGGFRTSLAHPATAFRTEFSAEKLKEMGMEEGLIRISAGIEDIEDIINDLKCALEVFGK